jgi:peptidyl-prolyl cis-trans isomerase SurA
LLSDIENFRKSLGLRSQLDPLFAGTAVAAQGMNVAQADVVNFLIDEQIILASYPVTDGEVDQEINSILANNKIDRNALRTTIREQGYDFESYFELIRVSAAKRNLIDRDIRTKVTITEDDIKNHFYNHYSKTNKAQRTYQLKIISVNSKNYKNQAAAKSYAQTLVDDIKRGERFESVAKRASDDPSSTHGGDLPPLQEDQMSSSIKKAVDSLKLGEIQTVYESALNSYLIIKLIDIKSSDDTLYEQVKENIKNQMVAAEYQHQISLWLQRQKQSSFLHLAGDERELGSPE